MGDFAINSDSRPSITAGSHSGRVVTLRRRACQWLRWTFVECRIWQEVAISFCWWRLWPLLGSLGDQGATPGVEILMAGGHLPVDDCQSSAELERRLLTRAFSDEDTAASRLSTFNLDQNLTTCLPNARDSRAGPSGISISPRC